MPFKFEKLEVWQLALDYIDLIYEIADKLPKSEAYNLTFPDHPSCDVSGPQYC